MVKSVVYLNSLMRAEIEVELGGVGDPDVDGRSGWNVSGLARLLLLVGAKKPEAGNERSKRCPTCGSSCSVSKAS